MMNKNEAIKKLVEMVNDGCTSDEFYEIAWDNDVSCLEVWEEIEGCKFKEINKVFKKDKMLNRLKKENTLYIVNDDMLEIINDLDGRECTNDCFEKFYYGSPVLACMGSNGIIYNIYECDCDFVK